MFFILLAENPMWLPILPTVAIHRRKKSSDGKSRLLGNWHLHDLHFCSYQTAISNAVKRLADKY